MSRHGKEFLGVAGLLLALIFQVVPAMNRNAPTADEMAHHVASGYSYVASGGDFRMNPASPPLPRILSALPLFFTGVRAPFAHPSWKEGNSPEFAQQFFYHSGADADLLILLARIPILILSFVLALGVYAWCRRLWGAWAGMAALALYVFCPDVLAHSGLATSDLAVSLFFFCTIVCFADFLNRPNLVRAAVIGVATGLALLSKFSAIIIFPILLLIAVFSGHWRALKPARCTAFICVTFLTVWAGYFFEVKPLLQNTPDPVKKAAVYEKIGGRRFLQFAQMTPVPLSTFSSAVVSMMYTRARGTSAFLMGEWSRHGWWYYYFIAFAVKNTPTFVLFSLVSLLLIRQLDAGRVVLCAIVVPTVFLFVATLGDRAQAGIRYFLPIYPLLCVAMGGWLFKTWTGSRSLLKKIAILLLMAWHAGEAIAAGPYHLAYFSPLVGGSPNGYRWLRDSNLDWGQGLKELGQYVKNQGYGSIVLCYPWPADPGYYDIAFQQVRDADFIQPSKEVYAISAHVLDQFVWANQSKPTAVIGHSIFVYDMRVKNS